MKDGLSATFTIKKVLDGTYGIWPNQLRNVVIMDKVSILPMLKEMVRKFREAYKGNLPLRLLPIESSFDSLEDTIFERPPIVAVSLWNRTKLYHPTY